MDLINYAYFNEATPLKKDKAKNARDVDDFDDDDDFGGVAMPDAPPANDTDESHDVTATDEQPDGVTTPRRTRARGTTADASDVLSPSKRRAEPQSPSARPKRGKVRITPYSSHISSKSWYLHSLIGLWLTVHNVTEDSGTRS
jgi:hypothetical protein